MPGDVTLDQDSFLFFNSKNYSCYNKKKKVKIIPNDNDNKEQTYGEVVFHSSVTVALTNVLIHPGRVLANASTRCPNPWETFKYVYSNPSMLRNGFGINLMRGTSIVGSQVSAQRLIRDHLGKDTLKGEVFGAGAAITIGAVGGWTLETLFIRRSFGLRGFKFTLPLLGYYSLRETFFTFFVLLDDKSKSYFKKTFKFGSTAVTTAFCQQQIVYHARGNTTPPSWRNLPNTSLFRFGFMKGYSGLLKNIGKNFTNPMMESLGMTPKPVR